MGDLTNDLTVSVDDAQLALNIYVDTVTEMTNGEPTLLNEDVQPVFPLKGLYIELGCVSGAPGEEVSVPV